MICTRKRMRLAVFLLVAILAFIWGNSLMPAEISQAFSDWIKVLLDSALQPGSEPGTEGSGMLRKIAHFTEFAGLGFVLAWIFGMKGETGKHLWSASLLCGMAAACVDETIQTFVPERGPGLMDVWIDTCGVTAGITALIFGYYLLRKIKHKKTLEETT